MKTKQFSKVFAFLLALSFVLAACEPKPEPEKPLEAAEQAERLSKYVNLCLECMGKPSSFFIEKAEALGYTVEYDGEGLEYACDEYCEIKNTDGIVSVGFVNNALSEGVVIYNFFDNYTYGANLYVGVSNSIYDWGWEKWSFRFAPYEWDWESWIQDSDSTKRSEYLETATNYLMNTTYPACGITECYQNKWNDQYFVVHCDYYATNNSESERPIQKDQKQHSYIQVRFDPWSEPAIY